MTAIGPGRYAHYAPSDDGKTVASEPGDAWQIVSADRDEGKRRALAGDEAKGLLAEHIGELLRDLTVERVARHDAGQRADRYREKLEYLRRYLGALGHHDVVADIDRVLGGAS